MAKDIAQGLGRAIDLVLHTDIYLLPEAGHIAHHRGAHHRQSLEDTLRVAEDSHLTAHAEAEVAPRLLEDMVQREEAHRDVAICDEGVLELVRIELLDEVAMMQHHALALTRRTGGVDDDRQVGSQRLACRHVRLVLIGDGVPTAHELIVVHRSRVPRGEYHLIVEDDQAAK